MAKNTDVGREQSAHGEPRPTDEWAEALSVEIQQCITRDGEEDPHGSIAEILIKRVIPIVNVAASPSGMSAEQFMDYDEVYFNLPTDGSAQDATETLNSYETEVRLAACAFAEAFSAQQNRELREERDALKRKLEGK